MLMEVISVGRAGSLVDWESEAENRGYVSAYAAENILNWRVERINGRNIPTLVVLHEPNGAMTEGGDDFEVELGAQIRVLRLVGTKSEDGKVTHSCVVELWRPEVMTGHRRKNEKPKWKLMETRTPLRLGKPLPFLPFVFHGPRH